MGVFFGNIEQFRSNIHFGSLHDIKLIKPLLHYSELWLAQFAFDS